MIRRWSWTRHAEQRASQRAIRPDHADLALAHGCMICQGNGCILFHLGHKETTAARWQGAEIPERALGTTVVLGVDGRIVTVFRTQDRHRLKTRFPKRKQRWSTQIRHWLLWGRFQANFTAACR